MASSANYSILLDAEFKAAQIQKSLNDILKGTKVAVSVSADGAQEATQAVENLDQAGQDAGLTYQALNKILTTSIDILSSMADQVFELDDALVEFRKVSDLEGQALNTYVEKLSESREMVARTTSELVGAATEFRKSGFNDDDAAQLAVVASMLQNVADSELSAGEASNFIVSQLKAFNLEASDASHVVDALNEVSNNFAVSSSDLSTNIVKASAALATGNTTYEESLGLFTAIVEITRNGARAARSLVSVQSRLTQVLDDQSSTGKALLDIYQGLGIELFDSEGQIRSLYDILSDLSKQWETLDTNTKDYIALEQAGANQTQNFMALMNNFGTAVDATATAYNSLGSAAEENAAVVDSLQGKTAQLRATFQDFANDVISSEMLGTLLELANGLLKIGDAIPNIVTQSTLLAGVLGPMGALLSKFYLGTVLGLSVNLGPIGVALGVVVPLALQLFNAWKEAHPTFEDATKQLETLNGQLEHNRDRLKEIDALPWNERTTAILNERDALQEENDKLEEQIVLYEKRQKAAAISEAESGHTVTGSVYEVRYKDRQKGMQTREFSDYQTAAQYAKTYGGSIRELTKEIELSGDALSNFLSKGLTEVNKQLEKSGALSGETAEWWGRNETAAREYYNSLLNLVDAGVQLDANQRQFINTYGQFRDIVAEADSTTQSLNSTFKITQEEYESLIALHPELADSLRKFIVAEKEQEQSLASLVAAGNQYAIKTVQQQKAAAEAVRKSTEKIIANLQLQLKAYLAEYDAVMKTGQDPIALAQYRGIRETLYYREKELASLNAQIADFDSILATIPSNMSGVGSSTTKAAKATKELAKETEEASDATDELNKRLKEEEDRLKGIVSALEDKVSAYETLFGYLQDQIDIEIDALEEQKKALQEQNEELQTQVELEEKLDALARAKSQKTMVYKGGRFQYVSDIDETSKAQADLEQYYQERQYQAQLDAIDAQIEALENQKKQIDIGQEQIKQQQDLQKVIEQLGVDFSNGWRDVFDDLDVYLSGYKDSLALLEEYNDEVETLLSFSNSQLANLWLALKDMDVPDAFLKAVEEYDKQGGLTNETSKQIVSEVRNILEEEGFFGGASTIAATVANLVKSGAISQDLVDSVYGGGGSSSGGSSSGGSSSKPSGGSSSSTSSGYTTKTDSSNAGKSTQQVYLENLAKGYDQYGNAVGAGSVAWAKDQLAKGNYATGTTSARGGLSLVGEKGAELRVLNQGDGIIPADITKNLWAWGSLTPTTLVNALGGLGSSKMMSVSIANLNLPEVKDGEGFVNYMKNNFWRTAVQTNFNR